MRQAPGWSVELTGSDEAPTGDEGAPEGLGHVLRDAYRAYTKALQDLLSLEGVPLGFWQFLFVLWQDEGMSQKELCRRVGTVEASAVNVLGQMERRGWIVRDRDPSDQRRRLVYLTASGRALRQRLLPVHHRLERAIAERFEGRELEEMKRRLAEIRDTLEEVRARHRRL